jgi:hypothetical protein
MSSADKFAGAMDMAPNQNGIFASRVSRFDTDIT